MVGNVALSEDKKSIILGAHSRASQVIGTGIS